MTPEAIDHYLFLTEISYDYGLIDIFTYKKRMEFLQHNNKEESSFEENKDTPFIISEGSGSDNENPDESVIFLLTAQVGVLGSVFQFEGHNRGQTSFYLDKK